MDLFFFQLLALAGLAAGLFGFYRRYAETMRRALPADKSPLKGSPQRGVAYALTMGMLPWAKESTRIHLAAYLRGIGFHIGIFSTLGTMVVLPFWAEMPEDIATLMALVLGLGAIFGAAGGIMRLADQNLRALSTPDDHFAVWLVTVWMAVGAAATLNAALLASFYVLSAVTLVYAPMGKIRHCLYFFFSRVFFGRFFGRRAVLPHPESVR